MLFTARGHNASTSFQEIHFQLKSFADLGVAHRPQSNFNLLQMKFGARFMFLHLCVSHSVHRGCLLRGLGGGGSASGFGGGGSASGSRGGV